MHKWASFWHFSAYRKYTDHIPPLASFPPLISAADLLLLYKSPPFTFLSLWGWSNPGSFPRSHHCSHSEPRRNLQKPSTALLQVLKFKTVSTVRQNTRSPVCHLFSCSISDAPNPSSSDITKSRTFHPGRECGPEHCSSSRIPTLP